MRLIFILFSAVCMLFPVSRASAEQTVNGCPAFAPDIMIPARVDESVMRIDNVITNEDMQQIPSRLPPSLYGKVGETLGMTSSVVAPGFHAEYSYASDKKSGFGCLWISKIDASIKLQIKVIIPALYKPGSCEYTKIMEHEMKHVLANRAIAYKYLPYYQRMMAEVVRNTGVIRNIPAAQMKAEADKVGKKMDVVWAKIHNSIVMDRDASTLAIDTDKEYMRGSVEMAKCEEERRRKTANLRAAH